MPDTLAQKIRTRYPGSYDDLDDAALEEKWLAKYPDVYNDIPRTQPERSVGGFLSNVLSSGAKTVGSAAKGVGALGRTVGTALSAPQTLAQDPLIQGVGSAVAHPVETGKALAGYLGRYSPSNIGQTLYEDPVGAAADLSTVLTGGGAAAVRLPGLAGKVGAGAARIGRAVDPLAAVTRGGAKAIQPALRKGGRWAIESALDASPRLSKQFPHIVESAIEHGVDPKSIEALRKSRGEELGQVLRTADEAGVDPITSAEIIGPGLRQARLKAERLASLGNVDPRPRLRARSRRMRDVAFGEDPPKRPRQAPPEMEIEVHPIPPNASDQARRLSDRPSTPLLPPHVEQIPIEKLVDYFRQHPEPPHWRIDPFPPQPIIKSSPAGMTGPTTPPPRPPATPVGVDVSIPSPSGIDLTYAQQLKKEAQDAANPVYRARERLGPITNLDFVANEGLAKALREAIERRAPEAKPLNVELQKLRGLQLASENVRPSRFPATVGEVPMRLARKATLHGGLASARLGRPAIKERAAHVARVGTTVASGTSVAAGQQDVKDLFASDGFKRASREERGRMLKALRTGT